MSSAKNVAQKQILPEDESEMPSALFEEAQKAVPQYSSNKMALEGVTAQLDALAAEHGQSVSELLYEAEHSSQFQEYYLSALSLSRQIHFFRTH